MSRSIDLPYFATLGKGIETCTEFQTQNKTKTAGFSSMNPRATMASKMTVPSGPRCEVIASSSLVLVKSLKL